MFNKNKNKKIEDTKIEDKKQTVPVITQKMIKQHPELYVEVTIYDPASNMLESEYIYASEHRYVKDKKTYELDPIGMNLQPTNKGIIPSYVFIKNHRKPYDFTNKNQRIPSRIVKLLYNPDTYKILIQPEHKNLNLILVIIGVVTLIVLGLFAWFNYGNGLQTISSWMG